MAGETPPEGMTEDDYDQIHAAVVETVRGRWFLDEFARRARVGEVQEMLTAIGRLESIVTGQRGLGGPADSSPHLRLFAQRAEEIAGRLAGLLEDLRLSGAEDYLCDELDAQVRAIAALPMGIGTSGLTREPAATLGAPPISAVRAEAPLQLAAVIPPPAIPAEAALAEVIETHEPSGPDADMLRLAVLAALDALPLTEKLALFA